MLSLSKYEGRESGGSCSTLCLKELLGDIAGDFQGFRDCSALGDQTLNVVGCCQVKAFRQLLDV